MPRPAKQPSIGSLVLLAVIAALLIAAQPLVHRVLTVSAATPTATPTPTPKPTPQHTLMPYPFPFIPDDDDPNFSSMLFVWRLNNYTAEDFEHFAFPPDAVQLILTQRAVFGPFADPQDAYQRLPSLRWLLPVLGENILLAD